MSDHRQLLEDCLSGKIRERVPVALWRHFPVDDQDPHTLARAVLAFQRNFDFDFVKVTPASSFCLKDWGVLDVWQGDTEGTRNYTHPVINSPDDWERLPVLEPDQGYLAQQLTCLELITAELGPGTPVIQTIFSPLAQAKNLVGKDQLLVHLRLCPEALHRGLQTIAESTRRFIEALRATEVAGVFYAVQHAQIELLTEDEYRVFGRSYDLQVLEPAREYWFNLLHLHGENVLFKAFVDYPVQAINWHDQETWPSLDQAQALYSGVVCGGLQRTQTLVLGTPAQVRAEAEAAVNLTGGRKFILSTGCVVPITAPYGNLLAAGQSTLV